MLERTPSFRFHHALVDSQVVVYRNVEGAFRTKVKMADRTVLIYERPASNDCVRREEGQIMVISNNPDTYEPVVRPTLLMTHLSDKFPLVFFHNDQGQTIGYGIGQNIGETIGLSLLRIEPHRGVVSRRVVDYLLNAV